MTTSNKTMQPLASYTLRDGTRIDVQVHNESDGFWVRAAVDGDQDHALVCSSQIMCGDGWILFPHDGWGFEAGKPFELVPTTLRDNPND